MPAALPWQPGQSGNPLGRKIEEEPRIKEKRFQDALLRDLNKADGKIKRLDAVAKALVDTAIKGDINAIKEVANRIDGMIPLPYQGDPNRAALAMDGTTPVVLVVKWGAPRQPEAEDLPMLELKATPVEAKR